MDEAHHGDTEGNRKTSTEPKKATGATLKLRRLWFLFMNRWKITLLPDHPVRLRTHLRRLRR